MKKHALRGKAPEWKMVYTRQAVKDSKKLRLSGLKPAAEKLLEILRRNRISIKHRLVYQVLEDLRTVKVLRMWTHYE